jgi:ribosomal protein S27AE
MPKNQDPKKNKIPKTVAVVPIANRTEYTDADIFSRITNKVSDKTLNEIYGGISNDTMVQVLYHSDDERAERLMMMLIDPDYEGYSFAKLCHAANMKLGEVLTMIRTFKLAGVVIAAVNEAPKIVKDAAYDAQAQHTFCPRCDGLGSVVHQVMSDEGPEFKERICPRCSGSCEIRVPGDKEARSKVLEVAGVSGSRGGPQVLIQQNIGADKSDSLEQLITVSEKALKK